LRPLEDVARAATRVFIAKGYRRALMADVARELELSAGALYGYVESKEALFHLAVGYAIRREWIGELQVPVATPVPGATLALVRSWVEAEASFPVLAAALRRRTRADARGELVGVLEERYELVGRHRRLLALLEQSALDLPELADLYYRKARRSQVADLGCYIERRVRAGAFRPVPDPLTSARFVVEAIAWFAWHRRADADSAMINDQTARATTIDMLATALLP
jgi:AcrR family transcriptional regulator